MRLLGSCSAYMCNLLRRNADLQDEPVAAATQISFLFAFTASLREGELLISLLLKYSTPHQIISRKSRLL